MICIFEFNELEILCGFLTPGYGLVCGTGISQTDLVILEKHVVYSLSKEKTTARFYIMQCNQPNNEAIQVPIKDVLERFDSLHFCFV